MNQVSQLVEGTKTVTVFEVEANKFLVEYVDTGVGESGYFLQAGYFTTSEVAGARAQELFVAESISGDMLVGDM
jgi:hypothetical protein